MRNIELTSYEKPLSNEMISLLDEEYSKIKENLIHVYHIIFHIFLFSIFESIFFWYYIVAQEEKAFKRHFSQINMISELICANVDLNLDPLYDYVEKQNVNYNNEVPLRFTFMLNGFLICLVFLMNIILKWHKIHLRRMNLIIMKQNSIVLCSLFCYEYIFFQNIIYNYKPSSMMNIENILFSNCKV